MSVRIGVLALQGDVREHRAALAAVGADSLPVRTPSDLARVDGMVIPGGESTTMSRLLGVFGLYEPLRAALAEGLPAYGSCAGMIMLASSVLDTRPDMRSLGAIDMTVRRNAFGRQVDSFETDLDVTGVDGGPMRAVFIRAPWVESVGAGVQVLAGVDVAPHGAESRTHAVAVRQGDAVATSFHPEVTGDLRMHEYFVRLAERA
ncbi:pyridoxal 5'-phosphate synthase glutaminase subunit PdxT [Tsukamurella sp. 8F]|uniref:pyridoxal 5'-phosphate synthase glutaminase subunit PdxT n=1 Tax=unclassified Tsukamurella TaxID=2633480 RepID=UPI0023B94981|nr:MULTISPECIES: pyridoxal 5'-phosphate synthase glutaminase subunit PdxT [unclassified Tsukamurella]MDF0531375.1 pyridoxal 5'-phosphate synthase glutaminase subunit PdxT [Tsukamurella sp. 8J]MDF0585319.1 pyridoxal 5'-phosphate synthase glutaminase subunit PdxT [Tsukamurella sp. 8F]